MTVNPNNNSSNLATDNKKTASTTVQKTSTLNLILSSLVGEKKEINKYSKVVETILELEKEIGSLTDSQLKDKTAYFRAMFEGLDTKAVEAKMIEILPEAFAVVREASWRAIGKKQFAVQLIGGIVLHDGRIAEMKTGEGKTYVAPLAAYLNALPKANQVHIVTVNDYLARVGASEIGQVFDFLGMTVGVVQPNSSFYFKNGYQSSDQDDKLREINRVDTLVDGEQQDNKAVIDVKNLVPCDKKRAYWDDLNNQTVDIVYAVNSELGFDYLRDNMAQTKDEINMKSGQIMAIVDEVDSILIDEARTPLIISSQDASSSQRYRQFSKLVNSLNPELHYTVDEKRKNVILTELGLEKVESMLGIKHLYGEATNVVLIHHIEQALKAKGLFHREKEYVVQDGEIIIVDEFTGRLMYGRRFNQGLHQAIEAKESLEVQAESKTVATITYQNFFRLYTKLCGMTGTAATESEELFQIYKLVVVTIPTNRPMIRQDFIDKIFKNEQGKFTALVRDVATIHSTGQPILIGTTSIDKNLLLSQMLNAAKIPHQVLNAKNHEQEARIISSAGKKGSVTLATNIAGRGVDIILGGSRPDDESEKASWLQGHEEVKSLGGLFVIGTERHESRRIDNQLRGRSGRQGDKGKSQFYISLEDYILRVFGGDKPMYFSKALPMADDESIQNGLVSKLVEQAQKKIEGQNYDIRKHVTEYDDVISKQRTVIYKRRQIILDGTGFDWSKEMDKIMYGQAKIMITNLPTKPKKEDDKYKAQLEVLVKIIANVLPETKLNINDIQAIMTRNNSNIIKSTLDLKNKLMGVLETEWANYDERTKSAMTRFVLLGSIDQLWTEHLATIDHLQDSTRLRYIAQKDPLTEFKEEAMTLFQILLKEIDTEVASLIYRVKLDMIPAGFIEEL